MKRPSPSAGVTLVELVVTLAIVVILMALAIPSYTQWIANTKVRTTAEAIQNGLMLAKAEALRRNTRVQFVLTNTSPVVANVNSVTASTSGTSWMVRVYEAGGTYASADFVQGRSAAEGGTNTAVSAGASSLIFNGSGGVWTLVGGALTIPGSTGISISVSGTASNRQLNVTISQAGAIRMCDPAISLSTSTMGC
jgi:type IV fimbrial biogenesis protein FimT